MVSGAIDDFFAVGFHVGIEILVAHLATDGVLLCQRNIDTATQGNAVARRFELVGFAAFVYIVGGYGVAGGTPSSAGAA